MASQLAKALRIQSDDQLETVVSIARDKILELKNGIGFTDPAGPLSYFDPRSLAKP